MFDSPHTLILSESPWHCYFKYETIKYLHFPLIALSMLFFLLPLLSPSNKILSERLAFLENFHTGSIKPCACVASITSKIAYHNEWASGPPSSATDTAVVGFFFYLPSWQWQSGAFQVCIKQVVAFSTMLIATQSRLLTKPTETEPSN